MNQYLWISISILILCLAAYVFGLIKNNKYILTISEAIIIPAACSIIILKLLNYYPESSHILRITLFSLTGTLIAGIFGIFDKHRYCKFFEYCFFTFSSIIWINLYGSTFLIYKVLLSQKIVSLICYSIIFLVTLIFIRKQKVIRFLYAFLLYLPAAFLNFSAFVTIAGSRRAYAYVLAIGTIILIVFSIFQILKESKIIRFDERILRIVRTVLLVSSNILITTSGLLMII